MGMGASTCLGRSEFRTKEVGHGVHVRSRGGVRSFPSCGGRFCRGLRGGGGAHHALRSVERLEKLAEQRLHSEKAR